MALSIFRCRTSPFPCLRSRISVLQNNTIPLLRTFLQKPARFFIAGNLFGCSFLLFTRHTFALPVRCEDRDINLSYVEFDSSPQLKQWSFKRLLELFWPELHYLLLAISAAFGAAVMNVYIPLYLGDFVNLIACSAEERTFVRSVYEPALKLCAAYLIQSFCTFAYIGLLSSVGERMACRLRAKLFTKLIYQDVAYFDVHSSGKLIDSISSDVQEFKSSFKKCVSNGLRCVTQVVGSVYALFSISPTLTYTLLGFLPCIFLAGSLMGTELRRLSKDAQNQTDQAISVAEETFSHIRSIKALTLENAQFKRFCTESEKAGALNEYLGCGIGLFQGLSNLALNGIVLGVLYVGGHLLSRNELTPGHLMSFLATTQTVQRSLAQLSLLYGHVVRGSTALNRTAEILHCNSYIDSASNDQLLVPALKFNTAPGVVFDQVRFAYPSRPDSTVLDALNLSIKPGQVVALVGRSGSGKSTVVSLLERFYDPVSGRILIDGHPLDALPLSYLRGRLIGYISQEPQIFNTTVRENIRLGRPDASDTEVEHAARLANAHEFITEQLHDGYETRVGQGTGAVAGLSGGQRQRIAIARVLLKNAPIILLDEATSALDAQSEAQVQQALNTAMKGRTVLIIAHRLSTIRRADLILVMSHGKIVEQGTHEQLIANGGPYYNLIQRQQECDLIP